MSNSAPSRFAWLLIAILLASEPVLAQGAHSLSGKVLLPNGSQPANPVKVTITFNGMRVYETFTDLSGRFSFTGLRRGMYQLTAEGDDRTFETTKVEAEISAYGSAPQSFTQNIQLRLMPGKAVPAAGVTSAEAMDSNVPVQARKEYEKGVKKAADNNPEKAVQHFKEAITSHSQFYSAYVAIAEQYAKLKRDDEAATAYQKAIEMKPDRAPAYVGLGVMLVKQKKYGEAIPPLRRSLEIEKQSSTPYLFLGLAEMMIGDYQSSETDLMRAYELGKPGLAQIYLANLYDLKREPAKAIEQLKAFLKDHPDLPEARQIEIRDVIDKLRKQMADKK